MLITFTGKMYSGKSTAVNYLTKKLNQNNVTLVKFAQPLYDIQEFIYDRISTDYLRPPTFTKDRKLLQWIGTEWGRNTINKNLWINLWEHKVLEELKHGKIIFCDDCRFDNEAEIIRRLGGIIIKIERFSNDTSTDNQHSSELGISPEYIDYIIDNKGDLDKFYEQLEKIKMV